MSEFLPVRRRVDGATTDRVERSRRRLAGSPDRRLVLPEGEVPDVSSTPCQPARPDGQIFVQTGRIQRSTAPVGGRENALDRPAARVVRNGAAAMSGGSTTVIRRSKFRYQKGSWTQLDTTPSRYGHPSMIGGGYKPKEGDTFDDLTGKIAPGPSTGGKMTKSRRQPEHILDYAAGGRKDYGKWYPKKRSDTAYTHLSGGNQGPHTFAHIGKRAMAEASMRTNKDFDPRNIKERTAVLPSPGQSRKLISLHEIATATAIPKPLKKAFNKAYKAAFDVRIASKSATKGSKKAAAGKKATVKLMELNPLATYALGRIATKAEIAGKNENREDAIEDLKQLVELAKGEAVPDGLSTFDLGSAAHSRQHLDQYGRAIGKIARGIADELSELDASSEADYSED